ncbi:MAG: dTDP-4-dehydrorhamnose reductase [Candidatus Burarchaeum sp.]|nr:dTDP-4-dehydrorhamnose reductase [Candidatus Burarchaeum sp.]MDO8339050.1 dTDP-4-dehydrorhamnose reductase [Candidatus Burarchaeum sp.]
MKSLLIIGGLGLLGNRLVQKARGKFNFDYTYRTGTPWHEENGYQLDVTDFEVARKLVQEIKPDAVINTTAFHQVDLCETERAKARLVNIDAALNLATACEKIGAQYVFMSTDYVFDGTKRGKYSIKDTPNPESAYAESKWQAESELLAMDADNTVARTSVIYGWHPMKKNFITWLLNELRAGKPVKIVDDQYSSPTLADNGAEALLGLVEQEKTGLWHVTGNECLNRFEFARKAAQVFGLDERLISSVKTADLHQVAKRPMNGCLDAGRTEKELGFKMLNAEQGLMVMKKQEEEGKTNSI